MISRSGFYLVQSPFDERQKALTVSLSIIVDCIR